MSSDYHHSAQEGGRRKRLRRKLGELPVFPTLLTSGNLACGVTAIFCAASSNDLLVHGAVLIFVAMFFDMLDGKVARMTGTEGEFGAELDSLADVVSFGVAPAMLVHRLVIGGHPSMQFGEGEGWASLVVVMYAVLTAIRLARYNVEHGKGTTKEFKGLPSPGAASFICSWVLFYAYFTPSSGDVLTEPNMLIEWFGLDLWRTYFEYFIMTSTVIMALLMVSSCPFPHFGNTFLGGRISFRKLVLLLVGFGLFLKEPLYGMIILTSIYVLIGMV